MLLQELTFDREKLLRTACEEVGYDLPLPKLKWPDVAIDEAIRLHRVGSATATKYAELLSLFPSAHKLWPTPSTGRSAFWTSPLQYAVVNKDFHLLQPIADKWRAAELGGITPGPHIRRMAADLCHAIDYIDLLRTTLSSVTADDYQIVVAKAALKKLGVTP